MPFCVDDSWDNGRGKNCADYAAWCVGGKIREGAGWAAGRDYNYPERHCCACGKGSAAVLAAILAEKAGPVVHRASELFVMHTQHFCRSANHEVGPSHTTRRATRLEEPHGLRG